MADPTIELLNKLNDESKWVIRRGVPVFKPHKRYKADGSFFYEVTANDLPAIASESAALESRHGVIGRLMPGHVNYALPEEFQPKLYGYVRNYRVGTFGPSNEPCILADRYQYPEHSAAADRMLFRSPEYYPATKQIRGLALLMRDPYLDLGCVAYDATAPIYYEAEPTVEPNAATAAQPTPEEIQAFKDLIAKYPSLLDACGLQVKPAAGKPGESEPERMQREQQAVQYAALTAQNATLAAQVAALQQANLATKCEQMVMQLEAEGYQLTRAEEVAELTGKPTDAAREAYVAKVRKNYNRVPVGDPIQLYAGKVEGGSQNIEESQNVAKANQYMRENKITDFMAAYAAVTKK